MTTVTTTQYEYNFFLPGTTTTSTVVNAVGISAWDMCDGSGNGVALATVIVNNAPLTVSTLCAGTTNMGAGPFGNITIQWNGGAVNNHDNFTVFLNGAQIQPGPDGTPVPNVTCGGPNPIIGNGMIKALQCNNACVPSIMNSKIWMYGCIAAIAILIIACILFVLYFFMIRK